MKWTALFIALGLCSCSVDITPGPKPVQKIRAQKSVTVTINKTSSSEVSVDLAWNPNPETDIAGYHVHYGTVSGVYDSTPDVGNVTQTTIQRLQSGTRYYFALTAYDTNSFESAFSDEIQWTSEDPSPTPTVSPTVSPSPTISPTPSPTSTPFVGNLVNISTRAFVQPNDNALIAGFVIQGGNRKVIVRAIGPSLSPFFPLTLANPFLELRDSLGVLIAQNDNWRSDQAAEIIATGIAPTNDLESAIVRILPPGSYTTIVRGVDNGTGVALVEVYALP